MKPFLQADQLNIFFYKVKFQLSIDHQLFDTAGIRADAGEIEDEGIRRAIATASSADLVLEVDSVDHPVAVEQGSSSIRVRNKADLQKDHSSNRLMVSAETGSGIDELKATLVRTAAGGEGRGEQSVTRERHFELVTKAEAALARGRQSIIDGVTGEMLAEEWREALGALDELTGRRRLPDLLDTIFHGFCIGK